MCYLLFMFDVMVGKKKKLLHPEVEPVCFCAKGVEGYVTQTLKAPHSTTIPAKASAIDGQILTEPITNRSRNCDVLLQGVTDVV